MDTLAREGRHLEHRRCTEEGQAVPDPGQHVIALVGRDLVPLVEGDDGRAARHADALGQTLVLVRRADRGVDHQDGDVGPLQGAQGAQGGVLLGAAIGLGRAAEPGGVDEAHRAVGRLDHRVDGVARRAGQVVHDGALLAQEPVEERRLPHVGTADDGDARRARVAPVLKTRCRAGVVALGGVPRPRPGEEGDHLVEQITRPAPVHRADREGVAQSEGDELPCRGLPVGVVDLVDHEPHCRSGRAG